MSRIERQAPPAKTAASTFALSRPPIRPVSSPSVRAARIKRALVVVRDDLAEAGAHPGVHQSRGICRSHGKRNRPRSSRGATLSASGQSLRLRIKNAMRSFFTHAAGV